VLFFFFTCFISICTKVQILTPLEAKKKKGVVRWAAGDEAWKFITVYVSVPAARISGTGFTAAPVRETGFTVEVRQATAAGAGVLRGRCIYMLTYADVC
jgi:hypothetical protein